MDRRTTPLVHGSMRDIPLPGHYKCLTLQLNVTRYQSPGSWRMVMVTREPTDQVEVRRDFTETDEWGLDSIDRICLALRQALLDVVYLQTGRND